MLAEMLNAPIAELAMSDQVNVVDDLFDGRTLLLFNTVLENVLNDQAASLTESDLMPHATESFVDLEHDLRWLTTPAEFEQFLPDMTGIAMDDSVRDTSKKLADHIGLVALWDRVESLLDDVAAEGVHAESDDIAMNSLCDSNDLVRGAMLEAALDKEVAEAVDHQRVCLVDDGLDDLELLLSCANLELLLQEYGSLLIIVADDLVDDVLPVAGDRLVKETAIVHGLKRCDIGLAVGSRWKRPWCGLSLKRVDREVWCQG